MMGLIAPTKEEVPSPIFAEAQHLIDLDRVIEGFWPTLDARRAQKLEKELDDYIERYYSEGSVTEGQKQAKRAEHKAQLEAGAWGSGLRVSRIATMYFKEGERISMESFTKIVQDPVIKDRLPTGFLLVVDHAGIEARVSCARRGSLSIETSPDTDTDAAQLFGALRNWSGSVAPSTIMAKWRSWASAGAVLLIETCLVFALATYWAVVQQAHEPKPYEQKAKELLDRHASDREMLELALAAIAQVPPPTPVPRNPTPPKSSPKALWWFFAPAYLIAINFSPKTAIGIGKGALRLRLWKWWGRIVVVSVPAFVLLEFGKPLLINLLK